MHALSKELNGTRDMTRVQRLMERYDASKGEWKRYAFWDCKTNYTRNLIATDQKTFTLMQLCWNPSKWRCVWALRCFLFLFCLLLHCERALKWCCLCLVTARATTTTAQSVSCE